MANMMLYNLEITFWKTAVPLMRESPVVQSCIRQVLPRLQNRRISKAVLSILSILFTLAAVSSIGFVIGFVAGLLTRNL